LLVQILRAFAADLDFQDDARNNSFILPVTEAPPIPEDLELEALIEEARRRARRRRLGYLSVPVALALLAGGAYLIFWAPGEEGRQGGEPSAVVSAPAKSVLGRPPYMGVSCPAPNSHQCDRVGLAVWLVDPARSVDATIEGRTFGLDDTEWSGPARHGLRDYFAGFLEPANLTNETLGARLNRPGWEAVSARVTLLIVGADGTSTTTTVRLSLAGGWG
jgi:hypothetical protein